jgi:hypothetical protein
MIEGTSFEANDTAIWCTLPKCRLFLALASKGSRMHRVACRLPADRRQVTFIQCNQP